MNSSKIISNRTMRSAVLMLIACGCGVIDEPARGQAPAAEKIVFSANFDSYEEAGNWGGTDGWKVVSRPPSDFKAAIGNAYGKTGKGLLLQNTKVQDSGGSFRISRRLDEAAGNAHFTVAFDYFVPTAGNPEVSSRFDVYLEDVDGVGAPPFQLGLETSRGVFTSKVTSKGDEAAGVRPTKEYASFKVARDQWHTLRIEVDQDKGRFRLRLDDTPVSAGGEEWFAFQTDRPLAVAKSKILSFTASTASPSSTRHIDNLIVSVP